ncbi:hypothetical protein Lal_00036268, partial [Lupinus albus]
VSRIRCVNLRRGGLGVKDIKSFNRVSLGKWNWRLLNERDSVWSNVSYSKYSHNSINSNVVGFRSSLGKLSSQARDLDFCLLSKLVKDNWFWDGLVRLVGDETNTSFWFDNWLESSTLHSKYQRLFKLSVSPNDNISNFGSWVGEVWEWNIPWRRRLFIWEQDLCNSFLNDIKQVVLHQFRSDTWEWKHDTSSQYSIKSAYKLLSTAWYLLQSVGKLGALFGWRWFGLSGGIGMTLYSTMLGETLMLSWTMRE